MAGHWTACCWTFTGGGPKKSTTAWPCDAPAARPAPIDSILARLDDPVEGDRAPFPDLWDRLCAQHGYDVAVKPWNDVTTYSDYLNSEEADT
ncbi:hypothetical protein [Streptomyces sp. NPDC055105]|uniref:hypothetical protein n=1 Tax=Streptomyces sp. NPDC055105 TaxID=3365719 RepID=UPI0037D591CF